MRFSTTSKELGEILVNMYRVINNKCTMPILYDIIFELKEDNLSLKASDNEVMLVTNITVTDVEGDGIFAVNAKNIMDAVKNLPELPLTFTFNEKEAKVMVDYFTGVFCLPTDNATEFPSLSPINEEEAKSIIINESLLQENIARTIFAVADDELRPVMNGIYFDLTQECLAVVASDGHQLVRNKILSIMAIDEVNEGSFILPKKPATVLKSILKRDGTENVTITFDSSKLCIVAKNFTMTCRLIEGRYPNYNSVIPKENPNIVTIDRSALIAALRRVSPFANDTSQLVRIHLEDGKLELKTEDIDFATSAQEEIACEYYGITMNIGLKGTKTMEILNNISSKEIEIQLSDPSRAALMMPSEQPTDMDILMLQMPMLLND